MSWNQKKKKRIDNNGRTRKNGDNELCPRRGTRPMTDHELGGNSSKIICFQSPQEGSERGDGRERRKEKRWETAAFPLASTTFPPPNWQEWRTTLVIARTKRRNRRMMCFFLLPSAFDSFLVLLQNCSLLSYYCAYIEC